MTEDTHPEEEQVIDTSDAPEVDTRSEFENAIHEEESALDETNNERYREDLGAEPLEQEVVPIVEDEKDGTRRRYSVETKPVASIGGLKNQERRPGQPKDADIKGPPSVPILLRFQTVPLQEIEDERAKEIAQKAYSIAVTPFKLAQVEDVPSWGDLSKEAKESYIERVKLIATTGADFQAPEYKSEVKRHLSTTLRKQEEQPEIIDDENDESWLDALPDFFKNREEVFVAVAKLLLWGLTQLLRK